MSIDNAKLVRLKISQFGNTRQDEAITDEVSESKHLGDGAGRWVKAKLPPEILKPVRQMAGKVRTWHYSLTCPWDDGLRLLADKTVERYRQELADRCADLADTVAGIDYYAALEAARTMLNGTFDQKDYPETAEEFRACFDVRVEYMPVPRADQLIVKGLADDALAQMRQDLEARNEERIAIAHATTWARLLEPVKAMAEKLGKQDAKVYRESLVENIRDICGRVDALNIAGDAELSNAARVIQEELGKLDVQTLRDSEVMRKDVAERAQAILSQFGAMGARRFASESEAA